MENKLLPCPFCGSNKLHIGYFESGKESEITCLHCCASSPNMERWNTRADRTCKMIEEHDWNDEWEPYGIFCSECDGAVYGWKSDYAYPIPKYCPNCGAKVINNGE